MDRKNDHDGLNQEHHMDITPYLDMKIAPRAVFDSLAERKTRVRFMVPVP